MFPLYKQQQHSTEITQICHALPAIYLLMAVEFSTPYIAGTVQNACCVYIHVQKTCCLYYVYGKTQLGRHSTILTKNYLLLRPN